MASRQYFVWLRGWSLSKKEEAVAFAIEAAIIDTLNVDQLSNLVRGHGRGAGFGMLSADQIKEKFQEDLNFHCEGLKIYITHIGGYPGNYNKRVKKIIEETRPNVFICGHSHILKVIYDKKNDLLHMNPGACGLQGFHKKRTMLKFNIENKKITNLNVIELGGK